MPIVTLLTDFGVDDPYVGQMKGSILRQDPHLVLVDLCHAVEPHDVATAMTMLHCSYGYFPPGAVHLAVVDPGVGGQRQILAAAVDGHYFVAPDNGLLSLVLTRGTVQALHRVDQPELLPQTISATFHGRDIMAPVAAALASGRKRLEEIGPAVDPASCRMLEFPEPLVSADRIEGQVWSWDRFGNLRTNITAGALSRMQPGRFSGLEIQGRRIDAIGRTYSDVAEGELLALIDSCGYLEIAVHRGNAKKRLQAHRGTPVVLRFAPAPQDRG